MTMEVQIMPALNMWPPSSLGGELIHPWDSLASSAAGATLAWSREKGEKWSPDVGAVWNADPPFQKHECLQKPSLERSSSLRPLSAHNRRKPLTVRTPPSLVLPPSPADSGKNSPGFSNRSDLEDPDTPTEADSSKLISPRTCINCGTTKTPLWRNGPQGYKSLCNACGIRLKKLSKKGSSPNGRTPTPVTPSPVKPATKKRSSPFTKVGNGNVMSAVSTPESAKRLKAAMGPIKKRWVLEEESSEATSELYGVGVRGLTSTLGRTSGAKLEGYEDEAICDGDLAVEHGAQLLMMLAYGFGR